jgi:hypothetical protein
LFPSDLWLSPCGQGENLEVRREHVELTSQPVVLLPNNYCITCKKEGERHDFLQLIRQQVINTLSNQKQKMEGNHSHQLPLDI